MGEPKSLDQTVAPYLTVADAAAAIRFYQAAFGVDETMRLTGPDGRIAHAELRMGGSTVMLSDEHPEFGALSPAALGGSPVKLHLLVGDADASVERAVRAGATLLRPVADQFHGHRGGMVVDPFGHSWFVSARVEELEPAEVQRRFEQAFAAAGASR